MQIFATGIFICFAPIMGDEENEKLFKHEFCYNFIYNTCVVDLMVIILYKKNVDCRLCHFDSLLQILIIIKLCSSQTIPNKKIYLDKLHL